MIPCMSGDGDFKHFFMWNPKNRFRCFSFSITVGDFQVEHVYIQNVFLTLPFGSNLPCLRQLPWRQKLLLHGIFVAIPKFVQMTG